MQAKHKIQLLQIEAFSSKAAVQAGESVAALEASLKQLKDELSASETRASQLSTALQEARAQLRNSSAAAATGGDWSIKAASGTKGTIPVESGEPCFEQLGLRIVKSCSVRFEGESTTEALSPWIQI